MANTNDVQNAIGTFYFWAQVELKKVEHPLNVADSGYRFLCNYGVYS